ncbi:hypothetical protein [Azospirillum doebereinerae]
MSPFTILFFLGWKGRGCSGCLWITVIPVVHESIHRSGAGSGAVRQPVDDSEGYPRKRRKCYRWRRGSPVDNKAEIRGFTRLADRSAELFRRGPRGGGGVPVSGWNRGGSGCPQKTPFSPQHVGDG